MKYFFRSLIVIFVFFYTTTSGSVVKDSLYSVYKKSPNDSIRFKAIDDFVWEYMYENPDTACIIAKSVFNQNRNTLKG